MKPQTTSPDSLKAATREHRGSGIRQRVLADVKLPSNWQSFLRVNENKQEFFEFLSKQLLSTCKKHVVVTIGKSAANNFSHDMSSIMPCCQEEADTRLMLHCKDAVSCGHKTVSIRTVDSDVVAIAVEVFEQIQPDELWMAFGTGKKYRFIPIHELVVSLGSLKALSLPFFHAFTGCDTTSSFSSRGKKSAWDAWTSYPAVTEAFTQLMQNPDQTDRFFGTLQRFVVVMYDRSSSATEVSEIYLCEEALWSHKDMVLMFQPYIFIAYASAASPAQLVNVPTEVHAQSCSLEVNLHSQADSVTRASIFAKSVHLLICCKCNVSGLA